MRTFTCRKCGQTMVGCDECPVTTADPLARECPCGRDLCAACWTVEPEHHESVRLFEPAPEQIPGQLNF